jgi:hypothetical protein
MKWLLEFTVWSTTASLVLAGLYNVIMGLWNWWSHSPKTIYTILLLAPLFERVGRTTTSYQTNWKIAPKWGMFTICKVTYDR